MKKYSKLEQEAKKLAHDIFLLNEVIKNIRPQGWAHAMQLKSFQNTLETHIDDLTELRHLIIKIEKSIKKCVLNKNYQTKKSYISERYQLTDAKLR